MKFLSCLLPMMLSCGILLSGPFVRKEIGASSSIIMIEPAKDLSPGMYSEEKPSDAGDWLMASSMPAMVSDILLENGEIVQPWLPGRAAEYQWIAEHDWVYLIDFEVVEPDGESFLVFGGLDGIVDVYLNGKLLASHSNMFMPLRVDVSGRLESQNRLLLHFHSIFEKTKDGRRPIGNVGGDPSRPVRRSHMNYNTYLGPHPNWSRVGVFKSIWLEQTGGSDIEELAVVSSLNENLDKGKLRVKISGSTESDEAGLNISVLNADGGSVLQVKHELELHDGKFKGDYTLELVQPDLWWPRGYGEQHLYRVRTDLVLDGQVHQTLKKTVGFRRLVMKDTLHFEVNNVPVRLWGGDWVAPRWKTAVWDQQRAEKLFDMAEHANFNAMRVWGVVECPPDEFYEMADQRGIMLWQDFTLLPMESDEQSVEICKAEAGYLLKRLVNHPSIFVWCGGNESAMWHHPEYHRQLKDEGPWPGIRATDEIRKICNELDPERFFMPSSPYHGIDPNDPAHGNTHGYTNLWFVPGYDYLNFASEDTRIAAPVLHSLKRFMDSEDIWPEEYSSVYTHGNIHPFPKTWLKYTSATSWRKTGPTEQFFDATDAASLVYRIGMAESLYYRDVIERQRRGRPADDLSGDHRCGGYLVWKFNDSWPQIYSAKVDYFLEPYHCYYTLKRTFQPLMLSFEMGSYIYLWAVNDTPEAFEGEVKFQLLHLNRNEVRKEIVKEVHIPPGKSKIVIDMYKEGIGSFRLEHVLFASLTDLKGNVVAVTHQLPDIERRYKFPDARINVEVQDGILKLTTDQFAKSVTISGSAAGDPFGWFFSDNYFDLVPGEVKTIEILGEHDAGSIEVKPWYSSNVTRVDWARQK